MFVSALAAIAMFAAPEAAEGAEKAQAKPAAESKPIKKCYNATPSGSRLSRKVCVTEAPKGDADDAAAKEEAKAE